MKVFLNPGHHPGVDSGAVNTSYGVQEADIVRSIGSLVEKYLIAAGVEVCSIQSDNLAGVSIHCNSAVNLSAQGTETLVYSFGGRAERAAGHIQSQLAGSLGTIDRGLKERSELIVLKRTAMPAVLVETAFISNEEDVQLLMNNQDEIARAIARGITDYFSEGE